MHDAHTQCRATRKAKYTMREDDDSNEDDVVRQVMNLITGGNFVRKTHTGVEIPPDYDIPVKAFQLLDDPQTKRDFIRKRDAILEQMIKPQDGAQPTKPPCKPPFQAGTRPPFQPRNRPPLPRQHKRKANAVEQQEESTATQSEEHQEETVIAPYDTTFADTNTDRDCNLMKLSMELMDVF